MKKIEFETLWSGVLGIIAVIAAVVELVLGGIEAVTVAAAIKDIAGTLAVVMVLFIAINDNTPGAYHKFFDLVKPSEVEISISKTVFVGVGGSDDLFKATKGKIVSNIESKCRHFSIIEKCEASASGVKLIFKEPFATAAHANALADVIDCVLLTFVAEYKRT